MWWAGVYLYSQVPETVFPANPSPPNLKPGEVDGYRIS